MTAPAESDAYLARLAQKGDRRAFDQLIIHHKARLFRLVRGYIGDPDDAYDILQDTFISAWLALHRFDISRDFAGWLRTIALNKCRDFSRRRAVRRNILRIFAREANIQPPATPTPEVDQMEEQMKRLDAAIAGLPAFYKEPLLLVNVAGLSHKEAAEQLRTSSKAIEMRLRRAKIKLSGSLGES
jgi:RNA polymerase sigma factor (sigma-70 family)